MELKRLGTTDVFLPEIGFGTWRYAGDVKPLRAAIERGAFFIDTAESYGTEEITGQAIRDCRERVFLATKVSPRNFRRKDLLAAADNSLRRLGTDWIDLYQLHWPNDTVPIGETMGAMEELVDAGKVRFIGVSNFSVREFKAAQAALRKPKIVSNQVRYGLTERTIERGLLEFCQRHSITVIAFSPLGMGLAQLRECDPEHVLDEVAAKTGKTVVQVALNWVTAKENVVVLTKAASVEHVIEDCEASGWRLSPADYERLSTKIRFRRRGWVESGARRIARRCLQMLGRRA